MRTYFYSLSDPRNPDIIRYIGKTTQKLQRRLDQHVSTAKRAKLNNHRSNHNINWINSLLKDNTKPLIKEIDYYDCEDLSKD